MFCFCNPFCFRLLSTMLFVYIHISPWLSFTGICLVKLEVGDIDLRSCAAEDFYCGLCYAGGTREGRKKKKVLFHLGSNLWLGLPALAKLKIWSWLSVAWLAALCQHCCMSKTDQVKHLIVSSGLKIVSMLFFPSVCLNIDLLLLFSLSCPCKIYLSLPLMFQRSNTENVN